MCFMLWVYVNVRTPLGYILTLSLDTPLTIFPRLSPSGESALVLLCSITASLSLALTQGLMVRVNTHPNKPPISLLETFLSLPLWRGVLTAGTSLMAF